MNSDNVSPNHLGCLKGKQPVSGGQGEEILFSVYSFFWNFGPWELVTYLKVKKNQGTNVNERGETVKILICTNIFLK